MQSKKSTSAVVGYQGEPGAYSEAACFQMFGTNVKTLPISSFEQVFQAVVDGTVDAAMLPIENSLGGSIHTNYDLMLRYPLHISGELYFRVRHCLVALPGTKMEDITQVMSHPQALAQCEEYLRSHGWSESRVPAYDTAGSAKMIRDQKLTKSAAICSELAAKVYGMQVLEHDIQDDSTNCTRFLLLTRDPAPSPTTTTTNSTTTTTTNSTTTTATNSTANVTMSANAASNVPYKTSLAVVLATNMPGVLFKALSVLALRDLSLTKIESRPPPAHITRSIPALQEQGGEGGRESMFLSMFYMDVAVALSDIRMTNALRHLEEITLFIRVLGSFPTASFVSPFNVPQGLKLQPRQDGLRIGIIGFGKFGQFLGKALRAAGHQISATSFLEDQSSAAQSLGVKYFMPFQLDEFFEAVEIVVFAVSVVSFAAVVNQIDPEKLRGKLVVDVLSVKTHAKTTLLNWANKNSNNDNPTTTTTTTTTTTKAEEHEIIDILCTHPMFGPESGRGSWSGLPLVFEKVVVGKGADSVGRVERFLAVFEEAGCKMVEMSCEQHDELAAGTQFVTHLTGRVLSHLGLKQTPVDTRGFRSLLSLVDNTAKDSFDLFLGLYRFNPASKAQLSSLHNALTQVTASLEQSTSSPSKPKAEPSGLFRLSPAVENMEQSSTAVMSDLAIQLQREGKKIISLNVGEPDFKPPECVVRALADVVPQGQTHYTETKGTLALRTAIANDLAARKGVHYDPKSEILACPGAKLGLFELAQAMVSPGDTVLIPAPYWVSYSAQIEFAGGRAVPLHTRIEDDYVLRPEMLAEALKKYAPVRMFMFCSPNNPTGTVYTKAQLEDIAQVLDQYPDVLVVADEIYERITFGVEHVSFAAIPGMKGRTVVVNGMSKALGMTGFRIGYLAGPSAVIAACTKIQSQSVSCPSSVSQYAAEVALKETREDFFARNATEYQQRRDIVVGVLRSIPKVTCCVPSGAFYVFPDISQLFGLYTPRGKQISNSIDFCAYLLEDFLLCAVPGEAFAGPNCFRIAYASCPQEQLVYVMEQMRVAINSLVASP